MKPKHLPALGVLLASAMAAASLAAAQNPVAAQPTEQQKLKERVDAHDADIKSLKERADRATFEKDRIDKIQQHYEDYYEKVHATEMHVLEAVTAVFALFIGFAALFGFSVLDQRIQDAVSKATRRLEKLEAEVKQRQDDGNLRNEYGFEVLLARNHEVAEEYAAALDRYRNAVRVYKRSKPRQLFAKHLGPNIIYLTFSVIEAANHEKFREAAKEELANELYDGLEDELAQAALELDWLAPLVRDRKAPAPAAQLPAPAAAPATAQGPTTSAPDKDQASKPQDEEK